MMVLSSTLHVTFEAQLPNVYSEVLWLAMVVDLLRAVDWLLFSPLLQDHSLFQSWCWFSQAHLLFCSSVPLKAAMAPSRFGATTIKLCHINQASSLAVSPFIVSNRFPLVYDSLISNVETSQK